MALCMGHIVTHWLPFFVVFLLATGLWTFFRPARDPTILASRYNHASQGDCRSSEEETGQNPRANTTSVVDFRGFCGQRQSDCGCSCARRSPLQVRVGDSGPPGAAGLSIRQDAYTTVDVRVLPAEVQRDGHLLPGLWGTLEGCLHNHCSGSTAASMADSALAQQLGLMAARRWPATVVTKAAALAARLTASIAQSSQCPQGGPWERQRQQQRWRQRWRKRQGQVCRQRSRQGAGKTGIPTPTYYDHVAFCSASSSSGSSQRTDLSGEYSTFRGTQGASSIGPPHRADGGVTTGVARSDQQHRGQRTSAGKQGAARYSSETNYGEDSTSPDSIRPGPVRAFMGCVYGAAARLATDTVQAAHGYLGRVCPSRSRVEGCPARGHHGPTECRGRRQTHCSPGRRHGVRRSTSSRGRDNGAQRGRNPCWATEPSICPDDGSCFRTTRREARWVKDSTSRQEGWGGRRCQLLLVAGSLAGQAQGDYASGWPFSCGIQGDFQGNAAFWKAPSMSHAMGLGGAFHVRGQDVPTLSVTSASDFVPVLLAQYLGLTMHLQALHQMPFYEVYSR